MSKLVDQLAFTCSKAAMEKMCKICCKLQNKHL